MRTIHIALHTAALAAALSALAWTPLPAFGQSDDRTAPERGAVLDTLGVEAAVARVLAGSGHLAAARLEVDAREALAGQAGRLPNPRLATEAENIGGDVPDSATITAAVGQTVEIGGDRGARRRLADREVDLASATLGLTSVEQASLTRIRYAEASAAQARSRLAEADLALARRILDATTDQVEAGARSPVDQTRAELEFAAATADAEQAESLRSAAFRRLAALWSDLPDFGSVDDLQPAESVPTMDEFYALLPESAAMRVADGEVQRRDAVLRLEKSRRIPDVTLSAGYRRFVDSGRSTAVASIAVSIPLFDRGSGSLAAARARRAGADAKREALLAEGRAAVAELYGTLAAAHAQAVILRRDVLPRAEDVAGRVEEGYREGKFSVLDALDAKRTLSAARARYVTALEAYHRALAGMDRFVASPHPLTNQP